MPIAKVPVFFLLASVCSPSNHMFVVVIIMHPAFDKAAIRQTCIYMYRCMIVCPGMRMFSLCKYTHVAQPSTAKKLENFDQLLCIENEEGIRFKRYTLYFK